MFLWIGGMVRRSDRSQARLLWVRGGTSFPSLPLSPLYVRIDLLCTYMALYLCGYIWSSELAVRLLHSLVCMREEREHSVETSVLP
jgi:hypothetical protein